MNRDGIPLAVDFHAHMLDEQVYKASSDKTVSAGFGAAAAGMQRPGRGARIAKMFDPGAQIEDMDRRSIDANVISSSTVIQGSSWADPQTDLELCRRCNDRTAEWIGERPGRFIGSFVLPLQDMQRSMGEFERATASLASSSQTSLRTTRAPTWASRRTTRSGKRCSRVT